jgi:hypothetical protein
MRPARTLEQILFPEGLTPYSLLEDYSWAREKTSTGAVAKSLTTLRGQRPTKLVVGPVATRRERLNVVVATSPKTFEIGRAEVDLAA